MLRMFNDSAWFGLGLAWFGVVWLVWCENCFLTAPWGSTMLVGLGLVWIVLVWFGCAAAFAWGYPSSDPGQRRRIVSFDLLAYLSERECFGLLPRAETPFRSTEPKLS